MESRSISQELPSAENLSQTWSETDKYIVYYYLSTDHHELIGFIDNPDKVNSIAWESGKKIIVKELPDGLVNLTRFEIKDMFGYDPNIVACQSVVGCHKFNQFGIHGDQTICENCWKPKTVCDGIYFSSGAFKQKHSTGYFRVVE